MNELTRYASREPRVDDQMTTLRFGDFEWDEAKGRANLRKHGVSFSEAATCFLDPEAFTAPDKE